MAGRRRGRARPVARAVALAAALGVVGCEAPRRGAELTGLAMPEGVAAPELALTDTEGRATDLRDEIDGPLTLVFFGYTRCPDVCPVHMSTLGAAVEELEPEVRNRIRVLFVSTDPEVDTPEVIRAWLDGFHPSFRGYRAEVEEINEALAELLLPGVAVLPSEGHDGPPMVGHPSAVLAFDSGGEAILRYPFGTRRADWLHDLPRLVGGG